MASARRRAQDIFARGRLTPRQLRTVSDRRYDDAQALVRTGENARANGAIYIAGFSVECLLKAELVEQHAWLANAAPGRTRTRDEERLWPGDARRCCGVSGNGE
jgi:hypothetical protein